MPQLSARQQAIQAAAVLGLEGKLGASTAPNYCLQFARLVIERALKLKPRGFYTMVEDADADPCAAEVEDLIRVRHKDWIVKEPQVGDLVFWHDSPPAWGHVGVVVDLNNNGVLEVAQNTTRTTQVIKQYKGALRVIALQDHPRPTTVVRLP